MQNPLHEIQDFLKKRDVEFKENLPLREISYVKIGGAAELVVYPKTEAEMCEVILTAVNYGLNFKILGRMSNILADDSGTSRLLVKTDKMNKISQNGEAVSAECGRTLSSLCAYLCERELSGFEELAGIPASVGGAVFMNAGAYGKEIADLLKYARVLDARSGKIKILEKEELDFSYRSSAFQKSELYILSCAFACRREKRENIIKRMNHYAKLRREAQPTSFPSLGSVFKRTNDISAAYLIDKCGLKGARIGGAYVSPKHAGFIINDGSAASRDYRSLIEYVKTKVYEKYGVCLHEEIEYLEG